MKSVAFLMLITAVTYAQMPASRKLQSDAEKIASALQAGPSWSRKMQPCSTGRLRPAASSALSGLAPPSLPFASPSRIVRSMPGSL
jgi:hypothetical protein